MEDKRNLVDKYKGWVEDLIREDLQKQQLPFAVLMSQINGDFNFGTVIRNANAFGAQEVFYYGKKSYDRRSAVGTQNYLNVKFLQSFEEIIKLKDKYIFIGLEQNEKSKYIHEFNWPEKPFMILIGEEGCGISNDILNLCDYIIEINQIGTVRSLNAGVASSIAMYDYFSKNHGKNYKK